MNLTKKRKILFGLVMAALLAYAITAEVQVQSAKQQAAEQFFNEGFQLYQSGDMATAIERYKMGLKLGLDSVVANYYIGLAYEDSGKPYEAFVHYVTVVRLGPETKEGYLVSARLPSIIKATDKYGGTPLHSAARKNARETAAMLIDKGADLNARNETGHTPLHRAAFGNARETAALLIDKGADVNETDTVDGVGWTPLHYAASMNAHETAALLIDKGADVNARDKNGWTPLHYAATLNAPETAALLRANGGRE